MAAVASLRQWKRIEEWALSTTKTAKSQAVDFAALEAGLIPWALPLLEPRRYKVLMGGRGSAKSTTVADILLIRGVKAKRRVLCGREFQNSLEDSVHQLLCDRIQALGLQDYYTVLESEIRGPYDTKFIFKGLRRNINSIKSLAGITDVWIEEAATTSQKSWDTLVPTIREAGSEIWVTFNPEQETDCIYERFVTNVEPNDLVIKVNWDMNPYFTEELNEERLRMLRTDPDRYDNIWEGNPIRFSAAQIFHGKWVVDEFSPDPQSWDGPYHGADWGFTDPTAAVRCWVFQNRLYIEHESYHSNLDLNDVGKVWATEIPGIEQYPVFADSSQPQSIRHVARGENPTSVAIPRLQPCEKWPGSVDDGLKHLRSYEQIVIHPRCKSMKSEAMMYRYKVDQHSGEVLPIIIDAHNHLWDSVRYALGARIKKRPKQSSGVSMAYYG